MALSQLIFLFFLFNLVFVQSKLSLDYSEQVALLSIQKELGIHTQSHSAGNGCNFAGIFCGPRGDNNSSYILGITRIVYKSRQLKGTLSMEIGKISEIKQLSLSNNQIFGEIPSQISNCRKLEILELGNNGFSGKVTAGLSSLSQLRVLDLSSNKLSGDLSFLNYLTKLEELFISGNQFAGKIPLSLKSFPNLQHFNISGNNIIEDTENNYLSKRYVFAESQSIAMAPIAPTPLGSLAPLGSPAPLGSDPAEPTKPKKKKKKASSWIYGFLAGTIAGLLSGVTISMLYRIFALFRKDSDNETGISIFSPLIKKKEALAFLQDDNGLESLEVIGRGGCGVVYKAELPGSNGKQIAIKKIIQPSIDAIELTVEDSKDLTKKMRQIKSEIKTVGQIRHRNLLPLLAHMPRPDCHYLVYEYMKNGSLQDLIEKSSREEKELDWLARHKIALGIATGLEYLHFHHLPHIIHRDLKPANVLLDDDMEPRIADFGLAKAVPEANTHVTTSNVVGTLGYIAPEYHQTLKFTDKCDMYSFGVLLAVLVMGKLPSDEFFQNTDEMNLVIWMRNVIASEEPKRAIDPMLSGNGYEEQMLLVLKIACFCTLQNPKERPNSKDVRIMLSQIAH